MIETLCPWDAPVHLIFSSNVPSLLFYSHGITILFALGMGLIMLFKNYKSLLSRLLFFINLSFCTWVFFDLIQWATNRPSVLIFYWALSVLVEGIIFILSIYIVDVYIEKKDISIGKKAVFALFLAPIIGLLATRYNLIGVDAFTCNAIEGPIATYYLYSLEILSIIWIAVYAIRQIRKSADRDTRRQVRLFAGGLIIFLSFFLAGNLQSSFSDNWIPAQYGLFGMPIFIGLLGYMIVRFKSFDMKLAGAQVLVAGLVIMVTSQFLFVEDTKGRVLVAITLIAVLVFGFVLVRSVMREIQQRERLQILTESLEEANDKLQGLDKLKTEFLSLASHQLRSPLTAIKGYTSMLLEGDFGTVTDKQKEAIDRVFQSSSHLAKIVEDLLNVSKIEQGGMKYEMAPFDLEKAANDLTVDLSVTAQKKGLALTFKAETPGPHTVNGDMEKIRQVVLNVIDNAIKYTEKGSITVTLAKNGTTGMERLSVTDTGMGISPEEKDKLFQKFSRGAGGKTNTGGSGLGLYLAKQIAEAHGGGIVIDSPGVGLGSTFTIELKSAA